MNKNDSNQDSILWLDFKTGNKTAFSEIYNLYIADLLRYGYRLTSETVLIQDSIQDLFTQLWSNRENLSPTDSIRFYLYRALRNRIVRNLEKKNPEIHFDDFSELVSHSEVSFEETMIQDESVEEKISALKINLSNLSKRQQEAIQLRYFHDFSLEQIAGIMEISNQSVRNTLHRALTELRQKISE